ncbi:MAG: hypothetical protein M3367_02595 [Acidobacteriota bacterium]|nr:hypothetical protein [Acidobacteriota bacterium]
MDEITKQAQKVKIQSQITLDFYAKERQHLAGNERAKRSKTFEFSRLSRCSRSVCQQDAGVSLVKYVFVCLPTLRSL